MTIENSFVYVPVSAGQKDLLTELCGICETFSCEFFCRGSNRCFKLLCHGEETLYRQLFADADLTGGHAEGAFGNIINGNGIADTHGKIAGAAGIDGGADHIVGWSQPDGGKRGVVEEREILEVIVGVADKKVEYRQIPELQLIFQRVC